jgi:hypothetical protein
MIFLSARRTGPSSPAPFDHSARRREGPVSQRFERLGDWTFAEFRLTVAELVTAALVGENATLIYNPASRTDILSRGALLASQVVEPLWEALCETPRPIPVTETLRVSTAARCLAELLARQPGVVTATAEHRRTVIGQSVGLAVAAAESMIEALG